MTRIPAPYAYLPVVLTWQRIDRAHDRHWHALADNDNTKGCCCQTAISDRLRGLTQAPQSTSFFTGEPA